MTRKMSYSEKLKDPRWQQKRLVVMNRDRWTCQFCGATDKPLNVHHRYYDASWPEPWEYGTDTLITACGDCHALETDDLKRSASNLAAAFQELGFGGYEMDVLAVGAREARARRGAAYSRPVARRAALGIMYMLAYRRDMLEAVCFEWDRFVDKTQTSDVADYQAYIDAWWID